jgi:hypothetical protein
MLKKDFEQRVGWNGLGEMQYTSVCNPLLVRGQLIQEFIFLMHTGCILFLDQFVYFFY